MSIFNIGGRFHETKRRHKHSTKEKEHPTLRSARSMDSLSCTANNNGDPTRSPRPPSTHLSPLSIPQPQPPPPPESVTTFSSSPRVGSEYAVTYRRGTGLVNTGTQGTYTSLDPDAPTPGPETVQTRSPGPSAKSGRRIVHITGPTLVTVPLHITSNLALGVLQRGGADRIVQRGKDKDLGERKGSEVEKKEAEEEEKSDTKRVLDVGEVEGERGEIGRRQCEWEVEPTETKRPKSEASNSNQEDEYMDMEVKSHYEPETTKVIDDPVFDPTYSPFDPEEVLNSAEVDDLTLSGYVQDNFDFLDQMDCSIMDCSVSNQVNEFSVEPPGHSDEEYETMDRSQPGHSPLPPPSLVVSPPTVPPLAPPTTQNTSPARPVSLDIYTRHSKSLSLPYMTSPVERPGASSSESEDDSGSDEQGYISSSEGEDGDDENMFVKSLPSDFFLNNLANTEIQHDICEKSSLEVDEQNVSEGQASQMIQDEILVEENELYQTEKDIHSLESETKNLQNDSLDAAENLAEKTNQDFVVGQTSEITQDEFDENVIKRVPSQTIETTDKDLDESESMVMQKETLYEPVRDDLEAQREQEVHGNEEEMAEILEADPHEETDAVEESFEPADGVTEQPNPTEEELDQLDQILLQEMDVMDSEDIKSDNPQTQDKEEITGGNLDSTKEEVCQETEQIESDGADIVVNILQEQNDNENIFKNETGEQKSTENIWDELEDVVCEVIEDMETEAKATENSTNDGKDVNNVENETVVLQEDQFEPNNKLEDGPFEAQHDQDVAIDANAKEAVEKASQKSQNLAQITDKEMHSAEHFEDECNQEANAKDVPEKHSQMLQSLDKEIHFDSQSNQDVAVNANANDVASYANAKDVIEKSNPNLAQNEKEIHSVLGVGSKVVTSKLPKVYQVKAVPIVPPKPQHCKLTALMLRQQQQQQQQKERSHEEKRFSYGAEVEEQVNVASRWRDGEESTRTPSMCFDEAVAIATLRRGKGKDNDRDRQKE
ncbi:hypothetical protein WMY93_000616 [Mugilogobius chulae]|uniref:Uncharacterized protein n=1 Tax=Mugilogobius chulae TaxID=88201 RepID=A0AAW0Q0X1_9GOBI